MSRNRRLTVLNLMTVVAVVAVVLAVAVGTRRRRIIESLQSPIGVFDWSPSRLLLTDGRSVPLPGIQRLPMTSTALAEATRRGVELGRDGRVYGLVRIHHKCGNDRVGEHLARVDIADLLGFLGEGRPSAPAISGAVFSIKPGGNFSSQGWDVREYVQFRSWTQLIPRNRSDRLPPLDAARP